MHPLVQQRRIVGVGQPQHGHVLHQDALRFAVELLALFVGGGSGGPLQVAPESFAASADLEPEKSKSLEAGFRTFGEKYQASIAAYNVTFDNRLLLSLIHI